jgi:hypothetical protein
MPALQLSKVARRRPSGSPQGVETRKALYGALSREHLAEQSFSFDSSFLDDRPPLLDLGFLKSADAPVTSSTIMG